MCDKGKREAVLGPHGGACGAQRLDRDAEAARVEKPRERVPGDHQRAAALGDAVEGIVGGRIKWTLGLHHDEARR